MGFSLVCSDGFEVRITLKMDKEVFRIADSTDVRESRCRIAIKICFGPIRSNNGDSHVGGDCQIKKHKSPKGPVVTSKRRVKNGTGELLKGQMKEIFF